MNPLQKIVTVFSKAPARAPVLGFLLLILIGTVLLSFPAASADGQRIPLTDALFTATSASCVTGLITLDTGSDFSLYGQLIILLLLQIGGIGIMSISTLFLFMAGMRTGLVGRLSMTDAYTHSGEYNVRSILKSVLLFTASIELAGSALLFTRFARDFPPLRALYLSVFHSVSAFCNAGFSLFSTSLMQYRSDPWINLTVTALIISGGIGFLVLSELHRKFRFRRRDWDKLSLHTKLAVSVTCLLLLISTAALLLTEQNNLLAGTTSAERIQTAFFQAVTARTAGFNTVDIGNLANNSLFIMMILMFVGACPGSCGGGVKVTTVATLFLLGRASIRGEEHPRIFNRTIAENSVKKATSLILVSLVIIFIGTLILNSTEIGATPHRASGGKFIELAFECVSAFGTVGLSTGVTPLLSQTGKLLITLLMFIGRLGPLSVAFAISRTREARFRYAEETIMIG